MITSNRQPKDIAAEFDGAASQSDAAHRQQSCGVSDGSLELKPLLATSRNAAVRNGDDSPSEVRRHWKDLSICVSLANLTFLGLWAELLDVTPANGYSMRLPPRPVDLCAAMANVVGLGALLYLLATLARRSNVGRTVLKWGAPLALLLPLNALRAMVAANVPGVWNAVTGGVWKLVVLGALGGGLLIFMVAVAPRRLHRLTSGLLLALSPFVLVTFSRAAFQVWRYNPGPYADKPTAAPVAVTEPPRRVLWVIFDEMDAGRTFANRKAGLRLPELDAFRKESLCATHAFTSSRQTLLSMPTLITGKRVAAASPIGPSDLSLTFADGSKGGLQEEENIFSRARAAGFDTAVAGWYHPYCRALNLSLTACQWSEIDYPTANHSRENHLDDVMASQARSVVESAALSPFGESLATLHHVQIYDEVLAAGMAFATDPKVGLTLVHFPIPHRPYIYDSKTGKLDLANSRTDGYDDALALADRTVGQLRRAMERAGVWNRTAVLISADHGYRVSTVDGGRSERWVPYLLRLPGQPTFREYDRDLETIVTADLLLEILHGRIQTGESAAAWLRSSAADNRQRWTVRRGD